jgi:hypothetical protein
MTKPVWVSGYRIFFALAAIVAMGYQLYHQYDTIDNYNPVNFFSFFTIESNLFAAVVFLLAALTGLGQRPSKTFDLIRGAAVLYITTTFVVYGLLLSGYQVELQTTVPWVDTVLHRIFPLVLIADWIIVPPSRKITFRQGLIWLTYPAVYVVYTLIRGPRADWYPYPFLDPREDGGYGRIALYSVGIAIGIIAFIWVVTWVTRWRVKEVNVLDAKSLSVDARSQRHAGG